MGKEIAVSYTKPAPRYVGIGAVPSDHGNVQPGLVEIKGPKGDPGPQGPPGPIPIVEGDTPPTDHSLLWINTSV